MLIHTCALISVLQLSLCANLTYYIEENKSPGTFIGDIADDITSKEMVSLLPNQSSLAFIQMPLGTADSTKLFRVSKNTGKLYTAQILDAELLCIYNSECFQTLDIAIYNLDVLLEILEIKVIIQDVNDNRPEFPKAQISLEFSEGNSSIGEKKSIPTAVDGDVGYSNAQVNYSLRKIHDEPFSLFITKGDDGIQRLKLMLQGELDREIKDRYFLQVVAKDEGSPPQENVLDIDISVADINDNNPVFTQKIYNVSVNNKPNNLTPIAVISAIDLDLGRNGKVVYHLISKTLNSAKSYFQLDKTSGEIFLIKKVPKKKAMVYKLYIEARDKGSPPLSAVTKVIVSLVRQTNTAPVIDVKFVFASIGNTLRISEDAKIGSFIAYVTVSDDDVGRNGQVSCNVNNDLFQLGNLGTKKYKLILKSPLDWETRATHNITVTCKDNGSPPLKSEWGFSIQVIDVNDVQPQFSQDRFDFWIHENQHSNFPVGFINVTDLDSGLGHELTYSLLANKNQFLPFQISNKGFISTVSSLDHEFKEIYEFQVLVEDSGTPSLNNTANVIVRVEDENDNAPYFTFPSVNPQNLNVTYYPHHTKNITQIKASDSDSQENAFLKYQITRGNDKQMFTMNQYTGLLSSTEVLSKQDAGSYELEFLVKDSGIPVLSARTTVYLTLIVSNKTLSMSNTGEIKEKVELHIVISIGIVTVTFSVGFTVFLLVCLLHHSERRDSRKKRRNYINRYLSEEEQQKYCSGGGKDASHVTLDIDSVPKDGAGSVESRKRVRETPDKTEPDSTRIVKPQRSAENHSQIYNTEGNLTPVGEIKEQIAVGGPDSLTQNSESTSLTGEGHDWSEQNRKHDRGLQDPYSCPQNGLYSSETNHKIIKDPRLRNFIDEETMIFSRRETTFSEMFPSMKFLYDGPECNDPISMTSLHQLSQSPDDEDCYTTYKHKPKTLPITRL